MKSNQLPFQFLLFTFLLFTPLLLSAHQLSGVNQLTKDNVTKTFVGNAFLLQYQDNIYALTVKHVLLEARIAEMQSVSVKEHITQWQIGANNANDDPVVLGKLLNEDPGEKLDMAILEKDWLVFEVHQRPTFLTPLTPRQTPIEAGEELTAYGCTYANQAICQQDAYTGHFLT